MRRVSDSAGIPPGGLGGAGAFGSGVLPADAAAAVRLTAGVTS